MIADLGFFPSFSALQLVFPKVVCALLVEVGKNHVKDIRVPINRFAFDTLLDVLQYGQL